MRLRFFRRKIPEIAFSDKKYLLATSSLGNKISRKILLQGFFIKLGKDTDKSFLTPKIKTLFRLCGTPKSLQQTFVILTKYNLLNSATIESMTFKPSFL
jgi:hypothetical protein